MTGTTTQLEVTHSSLWAAAGAVVAAMMNLALALVVAQSMGPSGAGIFFTGVGIVSIGAVLLCAGVDTGLLWSLPRVANFHQARHLQRVALGPVVLLSVGVGGAVIALAEPVAIVILRESGQTAVWVIRAAGAALLVAPSVQLMAQATRGLGDARPYAGLFQAGLGTLRVLAVLAVTALVTPTPSAAMWAWGAPLLLIGTVLAVIARRRTRQMGQADEPDEPTVSPGSLWRFSLWRGIGAASTMTMSWLDIILVAALASPMQAGTYAAVSRCVSGALLVLHATRLGIATHVSAAFLRGDHFTVAALYATSVRLAFSLSAPIFAVLAAFPETVLGLFGEGFEEGAHALVLLSIAMLANVATGNVATIVIMSGNSWWATRNSLAALVVFVAGNFALIPTIGLMGAAISWSLAIVVENALGIWVVVGKLGIPLRWTTWRMDVLVAIMVSGVAVGIGRGVWGDQLIGLGVCLAVLMVWGAVIGVVLHRTGGLRRLLHRN